MKSAILTILLAAAFQVMLHAQWTTATLSEPKKLMTPATIGDKLMFVGGSKSNGSPTSVVEIYNATTNEWSTYTSTEFSASDYAMTQTGHWTIFGKGANTVTGRMVVYDNNTGQWELVYTPDHGLGFTIGSVGNKVMLAGGRPNNVTTKMVNIYDLETKTWSVDSLSAPRYDLQSITVGAKIFFVGGGKDNNGFSNVIDVYDNSTNTWSTVNMSQARKDVGLAKVNDVLVIAAGQNTQSLVTFSNVVDYLDVNTLSLSSGTLPDDTYRLYSAVVGDIALFWASGTKDCFIYNSATNQWSQYNLAPSTPINFEAGVALGSKIYFTGENSTFGGTKVFIFDAINQTWSDYILPTTRFRPKMGKVANKVVIAGGGITPSPFVSNAVDIFTDVTIVPLGIQNVDTVNPNCNDSNDGRIIVTVTGGVQPYQYSLGNGITNNTGIFDNLSGGAYTLTVEDALGATVQQNIVITAPSAITTIVAASICDGEVYIVDGTAFSVSGSYQVILSDFNGCDSTVTLNLEVNPIPMLDMPGNVSVCGNELPLTLSSGAGFASYSWDTGATTEGIMVDQAGTYSATVTNMDGCSASGATQVTIDAVPFVSLGNDSLVCSENLPFVLDAGSGFTDYQWSNGSSLQTYTINEVNNFDVSVTVTDTNGCENSDEVSIVVDVCEATDEFQSLSAIDVFPNPSIDGHFVVSLNETEAANYSMEIFDQYGRLFSKWSRLLQPSSNPTHIPFIIKGVGMYYIKVIVKGKVMIQRIVIE